MQKEKISQLIKKIKPTIKDEEIDRLYVEHELEETSDVCYAMQEIFVEIECAFSVDWKWDAENILYRIKKIIPDFEYKVIQNNFDKDSEVFSIELEVNGEEIIKFKGEPGEIEEFVDELNSVVSKLSDSEFEFYNTGGDSYFFLLVPNSIKLSGDEIRLVECS